MDGERVQRQMEGPQQEIAVRQAGQQVLRAQVGQVQPVQAHQRQEQQAA